MLQWVMCRTDGDEKCFQNFVGNHLKDEGIGMSKALRWILG